MTSHAADKTASYIKSIAVHCGSLRRRTILIEARPLAQHMRMLFSLLWDRGSLAPKTDDISRGEPPHIRAVK
jgi:hypothetical protein